MSSADEPDLAFTRLSSMMERKVPAWMEAKPQRQAATTNHDRPTPPAAKEVASAANERGATEYVVHFIFCMTFFGLIGLLFASTLPLGLGLFFFFTDDEFIEWVLQKIGIRLIPETLGPEFIKAFVFLIGLWSLLAYWKDSAPGWLSPWLPPGMSWSFVGLVALTCAVLKTISAAVIRKLLPRFGIEITPDRQNWAILGLTGLGILALISTAMVSDWSRGH